MERRHFLNVTLGVAAGAVVLASSVQAAPLAPRPLVESYSQRPANEDLRPAVTSTDEVAQLKPEQVRWHRHWHHHWHRHWHHRHW